MLRLDLGTVDSACRVSIVSVFFFFFFVVAVGTVGAG